MSERRVLRSRRLQEEIAFSDEQYRLRQISAAGIAKIEKDIVLQNHLPPLPNLPRRYIPIRERSLYAVVRRRSVRGRHFAGRQAGFNHGRNVTFFD